MARPSLVMITDLITSPAPGQQFRRGRAIAVLGWVR
jgi:hypothetical protein